MSALAYDSTPYGIKALRKIRGGTTQSQTVIRKKIEAYDYFLEKVDPIIGSCITYLLCEQPSDVSACLVNYLQQMQSGNILEAKIDNESEKHPRKELKIFLATNIGPIISQLVNSIALNRPNDVVGYMISEIQNITEHIITPQQLNTNEPSVSKVVAHDTPIVETINEPTIKKSDIQNQEIPIIIKKEIKEIQLAVLGLGNTGKTSILNMLQGVFTKTKQTIGFRPITMMLSDDVKIKFYDLGGGKKIRDIWKQYYHDVHGLIYVIDGSITNPDEIQESIEIFKQVIQNSYFFNKPLLILINKEDLSRSNQKDKWEELLKDYIQEKYSTVMFSDVQALLPVEVPEDFKPDIRIESSVEWIISKVLNEYEVINDRVKIDIIKKTEEEALLKIAKERNMLKNRIASAFINIIHPDIIHINKIESDERNIFSEEDGLLYLAGEIGDENAKLPSIACEIAGLVGYHKIALAIIGGYKAPVSKKKIPLEWKAIYDIVIELRTELGI